MKDTEQAEGPQQEQRLGSPREDQQAGTEPGLPEDRIKKKIFLRTGKRQRLLEAEKLLKVSGQRPGLEGYLVLEDSIHGREEEIFFFFF